MKESLYLHKEPRETILNLNMGKHKFGPIYNRIIDRQPAAKVHTISLNNPTIREENASSSQVRPNQRSQSSAIIDVNNVSLEEDENSFRTPDDDVATAHRN